MTVKEQIRRILNAQKWLRAAVGIGSAFVYGSVFAIVSFLILLKGGGYFAIVRCFVFCVVAYLIASAFERISDCVAIALANLMKEG